MEPFFIPATKGTPEIALDPQACTLSVKGMSIPENAAEFYGPVLQAIEQALLPHPERFEARIDLSYFNSSSLKAIYLILMRFKEACTLGTAFNLVWVVEEEDEFMVESSEYFSELLGIDMRIEHVPSRDQRERKAS